MPKTAVLLSIKPKYCELIADGKKTIEVRKTRPRLTPPFKCYIYKTRDKTDRPIMLDFHGRRQVIGEFVCDEIFPMSITYSDPNHHLSQREFPSTCLTDKEIMNYLGNGKTGYGWHISDLKIYDESKELGRFWKAGKCPYAAENECAYEYYCFRAGQANRCGETLSWPPQSWCYVEEVKQNASI